MPRLVNTQKIGVRYFSEAIVEINEITLEDPNSNCKVVKLKQTELVKIVVVFFVKGTRCYTFNPRFKNLVIGYVLIVSQNQILQLNVK